MSAEALGDAFARRRLSPVEAVTAALTRIERHGAAFNAFTLVDAEGALAMARASERRHAEGRPLSPIDGVDPEDLRIAELDQRIERDGVTELVIATNPTMAGEATALFLADRVRDRLRVTRLASGLPVGADLEHADELTLGRALLGRRDI